jgi:hypothetical protein
MRTKTLLLTAALAAAGALSSMAQSNVYSLNIVGYVNLTVQGSGANGKFSMVANPLDAGTNTLANLIPNPPDGTFFYSWNGAGFTITQFAFGAWDNPGLVLAPGHGGFILTTANFTNTFVGNVLTGNLTNTVPAGFQVIASQVPQSGDADSLGLTPALADGSFVYKWNYGTQGYDIYQLAFGSWSGPGGGTTAPPIGIGESLFIDTTGGASWVRTFNPQ